MICYKASAIIKFCLLTYLFTYPLTYFLTELDPPQPIAQQVFPEGAAR